MEKALRETLESGHFYNVSSSRSKMMRAVRGRGNKATEVPFRLALVRMGVRGWKMHARIGQTRPDFYFPSCRLAVFIDGCFWHGCPQCGHIPKTRMEFWRKKIELNQQRDRDNCLSLEMRGINVHRFWEHDILNDVYGCIKTLDLRKE